MKIPIFRPKQGIIKRGLVAQYDFLRNASAPQTLWNKALQNFNVTNCITNSDFSQGTTGWLGVDAVVSGIAEKTATAQYQNMSFTMANPTQYRGHKLYLKALFKTDSTSVGVCISDGIGIITTYHSGSNAFESKGVIRTIDAGANNVYCRIQDNRASGWTKFYADNFLPVDLTVTFGAGNEPSLEQCDVLFATHFNGTVGRALPMYNGQLGSAVGADTNDASWQNGGLTGATDDYVLTPSIGGLTMAGNWTLFLVGKFAGTAGYLMSFAASGAADQYQGMLYSASGAIKAKSKNVAEESLSDALTIPTDAYVCLMLRKEGTSITLKRMDTGASVTITSKEPTWAARFCLGALGINTVGSIATAWIESYLLSYDRALGNQEALNIYQALKIEMRKRSVTL